MQLVSPNVRAPADRFCATSCQFRIGCSYVVMYAVVTVSTTRLLINNKLVHTNEAQLTFQIFAEDIYRGHKTQFIVMI